MIKLSQCSLRHGAQVLLEHSNATVFSGHKVGLVGANGSGKSSLFAALRGDLMPDAGDIQVPASWALAHMAQEITSLDQSLLDFVLDGDQAYRQALSQVAQTMAQDSAHDEMQAQAIAKAHESLERAGGYDAKARAARLLAGLGFEANQLIESVGSLSGGWRIRLSLAKALMCPSDLLLLDEPTNHLDLETVTWLEGWLKHYTGTLIVISHDRDFLDAVVDEIIHIENHQLHTYSGNYTAFEKQRAERLRQQQALYVKQQHSIAHMRQFIDRFRAKASKAKAAQSRLKALSRLEALAPAHLDSPFDFAFDDPPSVANPMVHLERVTLGYGDHKVLNDISIGISPGDRIGLLGLNGAGKSTLIRAIAGSLKPLDGRLMHAKGLGIGYFAQHQLEQLHAHESVLWHMSKQDATLGLETNEQQTRDFLGRFNFSGDIVDSDIRQLSGGEKARLVLALLVRSKPNLLLLDEPTNHLDLQMRQALTMALQSYEGAVMVVSHDRHLLTNSVDQFWLVHHGEVSAFDGDLDDYRQIIKSQSSAVSESTSSTNSRKILRQDKAKRRLELRPLHNKLKRVSQSIDDLTQKLQAIDQTLADVNIYQDETKARELSHALETRTTLANQLANLESDWLETAEAIEALEMGASDLSCD